MKVPVFACGVGASFVQVTLLRLRGGSGSDNTTLSSDNNKSDTNLNSVDTTHPSSSPFIVNNHHDNNHQTYRVQSSSLSSSNYYTEQKVNNVYTNPTNKKKKRHNNSNPTKKSKQQKHSNNMSGKNGECLRRIKREWKDAVHLGIAFDWVNMETITPAGRIHVTQNPLHNNSTATTSSSFSSSNTWTCAVSQHQRTQIKTKSHQSEFFTSTSHHSSSSTTSLVSEELDSSSFFKYNYIRIGPWGKNLLRWHFSVRGPINSVYENGIYHGIVLLPKNYPASPPRIQMLTPSGRFIPGHDICLSASSYHPETWTPRWTILSLVDALRIHMLSNANEIGGVEESRESRLQKAKESRYWRAVGTLSSSRGVIDHSLMIQGGLFTSPPLLSSHDTSVMNEMTKISSIMTYTNTSQSKFNNTDDTYNHLEENLESLSEIHGNNHQKEIQFYSQTIHTSAITSSVPIFDTNPYVIDDDGNHKNNQPLLNKTKKKKKSTAAQKSSKSRKSSLSSSSSIDNRNINDITLKNKIQQTNNKKQTITNPTIYEEKYSTSIITSSLDKIIKVITDPLNIILLIFLFWLLQH